MVLNKTKQNGAVLVIGLIILTMTSLIVVSGMNAAIINEQIAYNHQIKETSFQIADSGGEIVIRDIDTLNEAINKIGQPINKQSSQFSNNLNITVKAHYQPVSGFSVSNGASVVHYIIETRSKGTKENSDTVIVEAYARLGAM